MQETKHIHNGFSFPNQQENKLMKLILDIQGKMYYHLLNMPSYA